MQLIHLLAALIQIIEYYCHILVSLRGKTLPLYLIFLLRYFPTMRLRTPFISKLSSRPFIHSFAHSFILPAIVCQYLQFLLSVASGMFGGGEKQCGVLILLIHFSVFIILARYYFPYSDFCVIGMWPPLFSARPFLGLLKR